jgi:hypothetical protein
MPAPEETTLMSDSNWIDVLVMTVAVAVNAYLL